MIDGAWTDNTGADDTLTGGGTYQRRVQSDRVTRAPLYDEVFAQSTADTLWALGDRAGSVRGVVAIDGDAFALKQTIEYDVDGQLQRVQDGDGQLVPSHQAVLEAAFAGREWDKDAGLSYHHARWYDPGTARFLSEDPAGFAGGDANLYRYAAGDPINLADPSGLSPAGHPLANLAGGYGGNAAAAPNLSFGVGTAFGDSRTGAWPSFEIDVTPTLNDVFSAPLYTGSTGVNPFIPTASSHSAVTGLTTQINDTLRQIDVLANNDFSRVHTRHRQTRIRQNDSAISALNDQLRLLRSERALTTATIENQIANRYYADPLIDYSRSAGFYDSIGPTTFGGVAYANTLERIS